MVKDGKHSIFKGIFYFFSEFENSWVDTAVFELPTFLTEAVMIFRKEFFIIINKFQELIGRKFSSSLILTALCIGMITVILSKSGKLVDGSELFLM